MLRPIPEHLKDQALALSACVAGAASVADVEAMLRAAGFADVKVDVSERSREFIAGWLPGSRAEDYVASASIQATKPGGAAKKAAGGCCPPGGCG
jgi:hypothetical protein